MDTIKIRITEEDDHKVYRWRYLAEGNHEDMGGSPQPYDTMEDCMKGMVRVTGSQNGYYWTANGFKAVIRDAGDLLIEIEDATDDKVRTTTSS